MKSETRLNKMAMLLGLDLEDREVKELLPQIDPEEEIRIAHSINSRAAEAFLAFTRLYDLFHTKQCVKCGKTFAHTYARVTTCSDRCLRKAIEDMGFDWDPSRLPQDRFRPTKWFEWRTQRRKDEDPRDYQQRLERIESYYPIPLVVDSEALRSLYNHLKEVFQQDEPLPIDDHESTEPSTHVH